MNLEINFCIKLTYSHHHLKLIKKVHQSCPKTRTVIVQNACLTLMKGFYPLQMLTTVFQRVSISSHQHLFNVM